MSSGVQTDQECVSKFNELKLGRKYTAIFYKMNDTNTQIVVEKTLPAGTPFSEILTGFPPKECRYVVVDYGYNEEGANKNRICFVVWCPDTAPIKGKMLYTSSKDSLRKALVGIQVEIQGTDASEVQESEFLAKCTKI
ncbi:cofilin [Heterostelium album PN500]|uniref:Cofilin n=1 Tax=Heterostelium pallidum (strain ATCC 26659 / Pp 5 / PN500) TaxID=670386 RepID=D3BNF6_HETP5|nr:cofilin [Heterostelium album PN500]EFA76816.1 cofilin [Heterostelium album PN500]|eukprot:XP_020428948.1 cofilin [Heterostelium album PN500]